MSAKKAKWLYPTAGAAFVSTFALQRWLTGTTSPWLLGATLLLAVACGCLLARREKRLRDLAQLDSLTGLANRRHFELALTRALAGVLRTGEPLALVVVDVDGLKRLNDQQGHHAGDAAIVLVADALRQTCRGSDLCARWGGDEFVLLAPHTNGEQAGVLLERIQRAIPMQCDTHNVRARRTGAPTVPSITASAGFAIASPRQPNTMWAATLFELADRAMYQTKTARRSPRTQTFSTRPSDPSPRTATRPDRRSR